MPKFTETMEEGTIVKWYKKEGDSISEGEPLVHIEGEKLSYDVEAPTRGMLLKILQNEDSNVPIGAVIALVGEEGETLSIPDAREGLATEGPQPMPSRIAGKREARPRIAASPLAKKLAKEYGVDLAEVESTSPAGRITEADVRQFLESRHASVGGSRRASEVRPLTGVRKTTAERMIVSSQAPRITLMAETDASGLLELQRHYESKGVKLSPTDIIVKAVASALKTHPIMNSALEGDSVKTFSDINIGVAVATDYGLVVPVVKDAYGKSIAEVAQELKNLTEKARSKALTKEDISDGTFTVTNLGMFGVDAFTPLMNPPECAVLGVGRIAQRTLVVEDQILAKPTMSLCLSFDHRIVDGVPAAKLLQTLKGILEDGRALLSE